MIDVAVIPEFKNENDVCEGVNLLAKNSGAPRHFVSCPGRHKHLCGNLKNAYLPYVASSVT